MQGILNYNAALNAITKAQRDIRKASEDYAKEEFTQSPGDMSPNTKNKYGERVEEINKQLLDEFDKNLDAFTRARTLDGSNQ